MIPWKIENACGLQPRKARRVVAFLSFIALASILGIMMLSSSRSGGSFGNEARDHGAHVASDSQNEPVLEDDPMLSRGQNPLAGLSHIEIPVRRSSFLTQAGPWPDDAALAGDPQGAFDIYFVQGVGSGSPKVHRLYHRVAIARSLADGSQVVVAVADDDVPILLTLADLGEFLLVRSGSEQPDEHIGRQPSLRSRPWIQRLMDDESVVVVP